MDKWWSVLFAVVMALCALLFIVAPMVGWWLPMAVSTHAWSVDLLFYVILAITGFFFILTEALLCIFMYKYAAAAPSASTARSSAGFFAKLPAPIANYLTDPHKVEMAWTVVPAVILLYIAFAQVSAWATVKYESRMPQFANKEWNLNPLQIDVTARQWEWRIRYPSSDRLADWLNNKGNPDTQKDFDSFAKIPQMDDVSLVNELHVWKDYPALVQLSTRDVIHSFNLPHMRVKQDSLPGKQIPVWFTPTKHNTRFDADHQTWIDGHNPDSAGGGQRDIHYIWDLACAELCGWGHYRMVGRLYVHETREDFLNWLRSVEKSNLPPRKAAEQK